MKLKSITNLLLVLIFFLPVAQTIPVGAKPAAPEAVTYYVSHSMGNDANDGFSEGRPFETVAHVNTLDLQPGDQVRFKCGDKWRADPLMITKSGAVGQAILFGSYPANCANQPVLSGAQPIAGWVQDTGNVYFAALNSGANAGKFANGINQLFRGEERLIMGRWPNLGEPDGGYATVDSQPSNTQLRDNQLPAGNWSGAVLHIKSIRWAILNRQVTSSSGSTLNLGYSVDCWGGCTGWGYFLNNHRNTLDQDGEWYFDAGTQRVYLYSTSGIPADIEGSVVLTTDYRSWGGITLGVDYSDPIAYVTVENLAVERWYRHGIATPTNLHPTENHDLILQHNTIRDVDGIGINLATWVWGSGDGRVDGWRGGYDQAVSSNLIERANQMGINTFSRNSTFSNNTVRDIARIENLGAAGMGCDIDDGGASGGICTEDGDGIRVKIGQANDTGNNNYFYGNRLERIGYNGFDVFGYHNTFEHNVILDACISKGDCGGVRTFGRDNLNSSAVHDLTFHENIIINPIGNTDGCHSNFDALFGFGFYIDHYSREITLSGNTVISSTVHGILFQNSTGVVTGNTLYNNGRTYPYAGAQVIVGSSPAYVSNHSNNILFSISEAARTLSVDTLSGLGISNHNAFFSPYRAAHIRSSGDKTLGAWQTYSGKDGSSQEHWYTQESGETPVSHIFYNDTAQNKTFDLGNVLYQDLDQIPVSGSITLSPYMARILIESSDAANLDVSMALHSSADTFPGGPVTYTITLRNDGILDAEGLTLENLLPAEITNTSWQVIPNTVTWMVGSRYIWEIDRLNVGESYTFIITGQFSAMLSPGTTLLLSATASTTSPEVNPENNRAVIRLGEWQYIYFPVIVR